MPCYAFAWQTKTNETILLTIDSKPNSKLKNSNKKTEEEVKSEQLRPI